MSSSMARVGLSWASPVRHGQWMGDSGDLLHISAAASGNCGSWSGLEQPSAMLVLHSDAKLPEYSPVVP